MILYIVYSCPICIGSGDLVVLLEKNNKKPVFYCTSCCTAWKKIPMSNQVDEIKTLEDFAPNGVVAPVESDLAFNDIKWLRTTNAYSDLSEIV
jgi:hypothetical protein